MLNELKTKLMDNLKNYMIDDEISSIEEALEFAIKSSTGITHHDGSDYILHILRTAIILTELHSDKICIISSLLGWIPSMREDISLENIKERKYGEEIYAIVESLYKISRIRLKDEAETSAIALRKVLVGLSTDVRVIIVKLASRLDNLREVYTEPDEIQRIKCIETENVLIPIAHRLGINYIKSELENLCLKYLRPEAYKEVLELLNADYDELNSYIGEMREELSKILVDEGIKFRIKGRVKSVHSLYEKMSKGKRWKDIYDVLALRIIVEKESECYLAIGLIHAKYRPLPKRFKDYIAQPKENMYQSLHTGVIGPAGAVFEIQIRTEEMDEIAECGIASHWSYKEHGSKAIQNLMEQKLEMFRDAMELTTNEEEAVKGFDEVFVSNMVYVFTPNGDVMELPEGSTPVDFAYRIHSHIGDTMINAIVNDQIVPLDYILKNDDIVKINTNESSTPNKEWLKFVRTSQAKSRIKSYFSKKDRDEYIARGEEFLIKEIKRRHWNQNETLTEDNIEKLLKLLKLKNLEELYLSIGSLRFSANYCLSLLVDDKPTGADLILEKIQSNSIPKKEENIKNDIIVKGCENCLVTIANCCKPVLGDDIIGYITKGNGIAVHKSNCANLKNMDTRFIDISWNESTTNTYTARLIVRTNNIGNNLLEIVTKSAQKNVSIDSINTINKENVTYEILVKVPNTEVLKTFMNDLETLDFVTGVERELK